MKKSGYFTIQRGCMEHPLFKKGEKESFSRFEAWYWLIEHAAYEPTRIDARGKMVYLEIGQLCYSIRYLSKAWNWSKGKTESFINRLKSETMIRTEKGTQFGTDQLIITLCKYKYYRDICLKDRTVDETEDRTLNRTTSGQFQDSFRTNNKEIKEIKKRGGDFIPPTSLNEVKEFFEQNGLKNCPEKFFLKGESTGWLVGGQKTKWKERAVYLEKFPDFGRPSENLAENNILKIDPFAKLWDIAFQKKVWDNLSLDQEKKLDEHEKKHGKIDTDKITKKDFCKKCEKSLNKKALKTG